VAVRTFVYVVNVGGESEPRLLLDVAAVVVSDLMEAVSMEVVSMEMLRLPHLLAKPSLVLSLM
jgi:hypothetical protein